MATKEQLETQLKLLEQQQANDRVSLNAASAEAQFAYSAWQTDLDRLQDYRAGQVNLTQSLVDEIEGRLASREADFNTKRDIAKQKSSEFSEIVSKIQQLDDQIAAAEDNTETVKDTEGVTNKSESDSETEAKYADPNNTPNEDPFLLPGDDSSNETDDFDLSERYAPADSSDETYAKENRSGVPVGAERASTATKASAEWAETKDLRVILRVPQSYLKGPAAGPGKILNDFGGILFPYTPTISYDNQAQYGSVNPVHSNYTQYYFKSSQVGQINISAKFTVQNEKEGKIWLGVVHLLRSLTKMRWGKDSNAGSPPPVCRLEAYGDYVLRNVPVVISSFKFDLPDNVDYISVGGEYKNSLVPSITTFNIGLNVMYSRREMQDYSVDDWIAGNLRGQGYL